MSSTHTAEISKIEVSCINEKSILTTSKIFKPLKVFTLYHGSVCHIVFSNYGGGFVSGDSIYLDISLAPQSTTIFSNQANTRIYKSASNGGCRQQIHATVGEEALAVYFGDPMIPHEQSSFEQISHWSLSKDAVLVVVEWFEAGRLLNGERFSFENFTSEMKVDIENTTVIWDKFKISPGVQNVDSPGAFLDQSCFLNIFIAGDQQLTKVKIIEVRLKLLSEKYFHEESPEMMQVSGILGTLVKISPQVQVVRCAARTHELIAAFVKDFAEIFNEDELLGFNPFTRKF